MELFYENLRNFFCKIYKKTFVPESLFNKVVSLFPASSSKERTPTQVFSGELCDIIRTTLQNTSRRLLLFYGKKIYQQSSKKPFEKRKKWKQLVRKTMTHAKQKLNRYLHKSSYPFTIQKFLYSSFLCFPRYILKTQFFRNNAIP